MARKITAEIAIVLKDVASAGANAIAGAVTGVGSAATQAGKKIDGDLNPELSEFEKLTAAAVDDAKRYEQSLKGVAGAAGPAGTAADKMGDSVKRSGDQTKSAQGSLGRFTTFLKTKFVITLGDVSRAVSSAFGAIKKSADLASTTNALRLSLAKQGQDFDTYIAKLKDVSNGTVSTADLIKSSSKALLLGIPATEIAELLEIANASSIATGQSVSKAFNDIAVGIGRSSPLILDNLGLVVKLGQVNDEYAASLNTTADALTATQKKQALLNAVLVQGRQRIADFGDSADATAVALQQGQAAMADVTAVGSQLATIVGTVLVGAFVKLSDMILGVVIGLTKLRLAWNKWRGDLDEAQEIDNTIFKLETMQEKIRDVAARLEESAATQFNKVFKSATEVTEETNEQLGIMGGALDRVNAAADTTAGTVGTLADSMGVLGVNTDAAADATGSGLLPALLSTEEQLARNISTANAAANSLERLAASTAAVQDATREGFNPEFFTRERDASGQFANISPNGGARRPGEGAFSQPFLNRTV